MILFTVGTEQFPFNRLMSWIEALINRGFIQEEVVVQYGSSTNCPSTVRSQRLFPQEQFQDLIQRSRLIVSHCGEGTILLLAATQKPYILVPRSQHYREHVDDHQIELATALAQIGVPIAWCPGDLVRFLALPQWVPPATVPSTAFCQHLQNRFG